MKFCTQTLGCKVNQFETQAIENILTTRGHTSAKAGDDCDVCIINTCAVTAESVRKSRQAVRRMKALEPDALIAVCGCFSQLEPDEVASLGADIIGGSGDRQAFALAIEKAIVPTPALAPSARELSAKLTEGESETNGHERDFPTPALAPSARELSAKLTEGVQQSYTFEELPPGGAAGRTRALLKIQDGCDNYCAYCVIPYARGNARSLPPEKAAESARMLCEQGYREIVITGIEISSYGKDLAGSNLSDVVQKISATAPGVRLRLGSLDPRAITTEFCRKMSGIENLCGHFHLSLQSGCDETLKRMGRQYETSAVLEAISLLRRMFPDCGITADLITGFPGETDAEFGQTLEFIKSAAFSNMHIFPFSPRPGTRAADMPEQVEKNVRRERTQIAASAAAKMAQDFKQRQIGKTLKVLFERKRDGFWLGHSENYLEVAVKTGAAKNCIHPVIITCVNDGLVFGEIQ